ncbi:MAG: hypothetical protein ACRDQA_07095 [Nocardioidaceae bacterium]
MSKTGKRGSGAVAVEGRRFDAAIETVYAGGVLPGDSCEALTSAVRTALADEAPDVSLTCSSHDHSIVTVAATLRAANPLEAITRLNNVLDDALYGTGLFEEFDVTGKRLSVSPRMAMAGRPRVYGGG